MAIFFSSIFEQLLAFLLLYKYFGLFIIGFASSLALPIPASIFLSSAAGFASQGYLNIYVVLISYTLGSLMGDMLGYILARHYGEKFLHKTFFFRRLLRSSNYEKFKNYIKHFAPSLVFFSRFIIELSPVTNILAGVSKVSYKRFFFFVLLGEVAYTLLYGLAGFYLGDQWKNDIYFIVKAITTILVIGISINLFQFYLYKKRKDRF